MQAFTCNQCNRILDLDDYRYAKAVSRSDEHKCWSCLDSTKERYDKR